MLFRDAFGHKARNLEMSGDFRSRVAKVTGLDKIPKDAWWSSEYPFNSLVGALTLHSQGDAHIERPAPNSANGNLLALIKGGREDFDFIISFQNELILIEAKGYTAWGNEQVSNKLERLRILYEYYMGLPHINDERVKLHLVITSPSRPQRLSAQWPSWACRGQVPPWMPMGVADITDGMLWTVRCDANGARTIDGNHWRISKKRR